MYVCICATLILNVSLAGSFWLSWGYYDNRSGKQANGISIGLASISECVALAFRLGYRHPIVSAKLNMTLFIYNREMSAHHRHFLLARVSTPNFSASDRISSSNERHERASLRQLSSDIPIRLSRIFTYSHARIYADFSLLVPRSLDTKGWRIDENYKSEQFTR